MPTTSTLTNYTASMLLHERNVDVLSCADNGPGEKVVKFGDGREVKAATFEDAVQRLVSSQHQ
jgi:hypothetical protein